MPIGFDIDGHIATLTLDRPAAMNALDPDMHRDLVAALDRVEADPDVRVAILTGAGDKAFSAGSDLKIMPPTESFAVLTFGAAAPPSAYAVVGTGSKPLIAAINGIAMGGGLELALACDIRIASDNARFGLPEVVVGTIPAGGGTQRLPRAIGASDAMLMLLTGDAIDAAEALRIGLVSRVTSRADLGTEAKRIAERIAANAPLSVRAVRRLVQQYRDAPLEAGLDAERLTWGTLRDTEDRIEGRRAFAGKRKPVYRGR